MNGLGQIGDISLTRKRLIDGGFVGGGDGVTSQDVVSCELGCCLAEEDLETARMELLHGVSESLTEAKRQMS